MAYVKMEKCKNPKCTSSAGIPICCNSDLEEFGLCMDCTIPIAFGFGTREEGEDDERRD